MYVMLLFGGFRVFAGLTWLKLAFALLELILVQYFKWMLRLFVVGLYVSRV